MNRQAVKTVSVIFLALVLFLAGFWLGLTKKVDINIDSNLRYPAKTEAVSFQPTTVPDSAVSVTQPGPAPSGSEAVTNTPAETAPSETPQVGLTASSGKEEIVSEYIRIYNNTRSNPSFTGSDNMDFSNLIVNGNENKTVENLFGKLASNYSGATGIPLPPYEDEKDGVYSTQYAETCLITADDIEQASYADNGNGTATIRLVPKTCVNSSRYGDSQGKMFNVINFSNNSDGSFAEELRITNGGGWCEVTYDKASLQMVNAQYVLKAEVYLKNPNLPLLKNKEIQFNMEYTANYPQ